VPATRLLPDRYRGPQPVGTGGMGEIFRATDATLGRAVAIKILAERYAADEDVRNRFTREALAAARLSGDPHTVTIYDVGEFDGRPYIVMEYMAGGSLQERLRDGRPPIGEALRWLEQAAQALDHAHAEGVVHRDVKPANLLLDRGGNLHVADFGIASAVGLDSLTLTGTIMGTAGYLSPEQARGERATPASDRYALGVVAFELLTGSRPFAGDSITAEATAHVNAPIPSANEREPDLPPAVDDVFYRALAKDPADRYPSAAEFVAALHDAVHGAADVTRPLAAVAPAEEGVAAPLPPARRRMPLWPLAAAALAAAAIAGVLAAVLTGGNDNNGAAVTTFVKTVRLRGTTVRETVTRSVAAPKPRARPSTAAAVQPAPTGGHALNDAGYAKMRAGDYAGALPLLQQAVQKLKGTGPSDPYEGYANYNLGYTLLKLGRCDEALTYLQVADRLEPNNADVRRAIQSAQGCASPAAATAAEPASSDAHALNDAGYAKMRAGDYSGALPLLRQAVQKLSGAGPSDPYEGYANYNLGYTLLQLGQCDEALTYLQNADRLEPHNNQVRDATKRAHQCK
jgi:eukaryotic-like serine/threonine-protein kinase